MTQYGGAIEKASIHSNRVQLSKNSLQFTFILMMNNDNGLTVNSNTCCHVYRVLWMAVTLNRGSSEENTVLLTVVVFASNTVKTTNKTIIKACHKI